MTSLLKIDFRYFAELPYTRPQTHDANPSKKVHYEYRAIVSCTLRCPQVYAVNIMEATKWHLVLTFAILNMTQLAFCRNIIICLDFIHCEPKHIFVHSWLSNQILIFCIFLSYFMIIDRSLHNRSMKVLFYISFIFKKHWSIHELCFFNIDMNMYVYEVWWFIINLFWVYNQWSSKKKTYSSFHSVLKLISRYWTDYGWRFLNSSTFAL